MNGPSSMMMMQSAHRDVLEATPDTDESKTKLIEELQSRGRAAVGAGSWMDAKLLYEKALTTCKSITSIEDKNRMAILSSNLSLVLKNMGSMEEARKAAVEATEVDPSYVKGWWRLGQALQSLQRSSEAVKALSKAKELEPNNKALLKELEKCQKKADEEAKLLKEAEEKKKMDEAQKAMDATSVKTKATTTTTATTTSKVSSSTSTTTTTTKMDVDDEEKIFTKSDAVRGYKIVNGKKTSYFHNELSEEAKTLIGDIAPKKLDASVDTTTTTAEASSSTPSGASAWNKAGTWEEKDLTSWAKTTLQEQIEQAKYILPDSSPAPGAEVTVSKVTTVDGHASCALARGKKRYIYEFIVKLEWKLHSPTSGLDCTGSLAFPDIDGTIELGEGYEMHQFVVDSVSDNSVQPLIERFVQRGGFHDSLNTAIDDWVRRFKSEY